MTSLTPIEWQVLELTAREPENLEQIHEHLHRPPWTTRLADAADALRALVEKGMLSPRHDEAPPPEDLSRVWKATFEPTPQGREVLSQVRPGPPPGWPKGRVYLGMFEGLIPDIPFEVFKENRREMSPKYSEEPGDE